MHDVGHLDVAVRDPARVHAPATHSTSVGEQSSKSISRILGGIDAQSGFRLPGEVVRWSHFFLQSMRVKSRVNRGHDVGHVDVAVRDHARVHAPATQVLRV